MKVLKGDSGIKILFRPMKSGLVDFRYLVKAGAVDESPKEWGYCHALEHMVFAGTEKRTWQEINLEYEKYGVWYNAETFHDRTIYQATGLKNYWQESYEILADMFYNCTLPKDKWEEVEKVAVITEIEGSLEDEESVLNEKLYTKGIGSRYHSVVGDLDVIKKASISDLTTFYNEYYQGDNVYLLVTGDITEKKLLKAINKYDRLKYRGGVKRKKFRFNYDYSPIKVIKPGSQMGYLQTLLPLPATSTLRSQIGLEIGISCLEQYLFEELREKRGLVYGAEAFVYDDIPGHLFLNCRTSSDMDRFKETTRAFEKAMLDSAEECLTDERINNMKVFDTCRTTNASENINSSYMWIWEAFLNKVYFGDPYEKRLKVLELLTPSAIRSICKLQNIGNYKLGKLVGSK